MSISRRDFLENAQLTLAAAKIMPRSRPHGEQNPASPGAFSNPRKSYGSYFGEWIQGEFGLPEFHYTCDQIHDAKAVTEVNPGVLGSTEHVHQVGNDRLVAIASNYGHVRVRQDEGAPKFLNDYAPDRGCFAGGFGYLTDGKAVLSTLYPGNADSFDRVFGIGYFGKRVSGHGYAVDQIIFAPLRRRCCPGFASYDRQHRPLRGKPSLDRILGMADLSVLVSFHAPGVVTAVLINSPLMSMLALRALRERWVCGPKAAIFAVALPLVIGGLIASLFIMMG
jgi:hypothetical protein